IRGQNPGVTGLTAEYVHFIDVRASLSSPQHSVLERLLRYGPRHEPLALEGRSLWVVPRFGTISPWSSKATDIARLCGLEQVARIERGVAYTIAGEVRDDAALLRALHDRMTESILDRV